MVKTLRQLNPVEQQEVARLCGTRPGGPAEDVIRALSRRVGAFTWGVFPAGTEEALLDQGGCRAGLAPMVLRTPDALRVRRRELLGRYIRQAWQAQTDERRHLLLHAALAAWDSPTQPSPPFVAVTSTNAAAHP
ncbi:MAG: hypothetical protein FD129_2552, partial [bacterium]